MGHYAIELTSVTKHFGDKRALQGVSFTVPVGSVVGVLGPNGAGKTTTINILSTLIRPTSGRASVAGYDVVTQPGPPQHRPHRPVRRRRRTAHRPGEPGAVRTAARHESQAGPAARSRRDVWTLVSTLTGQGISVLLTTQYLEEADPLSDSIVVIDRGAVIADGRPDELKRRVGGSYCQVTRSTWPTCGASPPRCPASTAWRPTPNPAQCRCPRTGVATVGEVFRRVEALGVELTDISLRKPSLDEVFFKLTGEGVTAWPR